MSSTHVDATVYLQVEPEWGYRTGPDGERPVLGAKVVAMTQKRPGRPKSGTVTTKLIIRVPKIAFLPLRPEAVIVIPEDMLAINDPIEVEAGDPSNG